MDFDGGGVTSGGKVRVYFTFNAGDGWSAPEDPRWAFAGKPYLLKLYLVETAVTDLSDNTDEATSFLQQSLAQIDAQLFADSNNDS